MKRVNNSVRETLANRRFVEANNIFIQKKNRSNKSATSDGEEEESVARTSFFVPQRLVVKHQGEPYEYDLNLVQRIFLTLDEPSASSASFVIHVAIAIGATIILAVVYVMGTVPSFQYQPTSCDAPACDHDAVLCPYRTVCEPQPLAYLQVIEYVCLVLFMVDYLLRMALCAFVPTRLARVYSDEKPPPPPPQSKSKSDDNQGEDSTPTGGSTKDDVVLPWELESDNTGSNKSPSGKTDKSLGQQHQPPRDDYPYSRVYQWIRYFFLPMNLVDFFTVFPFIVRIAGVPDFEARFYIIRVIRLSKLLRGFQMGEELGGASILFRTIVLSSPALAILSLFAGIAVVIFGSVMYFAECGNFTVTSDYPNGVFMRFSKLTNELQLTPFLSIPAAMYWAVTTSTTVGYGDLTPNSYAGMFVAVMCAYSGVLVLSLPISVIGNNFDKLFDEAKGSFSELVVRCVLELANLDEDEVAKAGAIANEDERALAFARLKAKKLSSILVISEAMLNSRHHREVTRLLMTMGLQESLTALVKPDFDWYKERGRLPRSMYRRKKGGAASGSRRALASHDRSGTMEGNNATDEVGIVNEDDDLGKVLEASKKLGSVVSTLRKARGVDDESLTNEKVLDRAIGRADEAVDRFESSLIRSINKESSAALFYGVPRRLTAGSHEPVGLSNYLSKRSDPWQFAAAESVTPKKSVSIRDHGSKKNVSIRDHGPKENVSIRDHGPKSSQNQVVTETGHSTSAEDAVARGTNTNTNTVPNDTNGGGV